MQTPNVNQNTEKKNNSQYPIAASLVNIESR